jgi:mono/diheme cytochrome c family protein
MLAAVLSDPKTLFGMKCLQPITARALFLLISIGCTCDVVPVGAAAALAPGAVAADGTRILAVHCLECHSGPKPKGDLDLSFRSKALAGGETAPALVPGEPSKSLVWKKLRLDKMPPKKKLAAEDKEIIRQWIEGGAPYAEDPIDRFHYSTDQRGGYDWWSLQPVRRPAPPQVSKRDWPRNPIDNFVLARLEARGLQPAPAAEPRILIRRLYFDLVGLPPEPEEVAAFVEAARMDLQSALEKWSDQLLDSPHYGERWARHWLDVARFGESDGFEYDALRPQAWAYRDWVIQAFNRDLPYDQFARLQIAGDVLEPGMDDAIVATGFLVCGAFDGLLPQGDKMRKIMRQDEMEDLVGTVSQTFLGLTVNCARCHDHKFDPVRQKEYYQMASALAGVHRGDRELPPEDDLNALANRIKSLSGQIEQLEEPIRKAIQTEAAAATQTSVTPPRPVSRWTFDVDFRDELGRLDGEPKGGARIENGSLRLDGKTAYVATAPLTASLKEKTLEAWVKLEGLDQSGGAAMSVQGLDGGRFDAIGFAEREKKRWMAGSDGFSRTQSFQGREERDALQGFVHVAIVYQADGTITGYRNGLPYGQSYQSDGPALFESGTTQVLFGLRHGTGPVPGRMLAGWIDCAQLYDHALTAEAVAASARVKPVSEEQIVERLTPDQRQSRTGWLKEITRLREALAQTQKRKAYAVTPKEAPVTHLLVRGSPFQPGEVVAAGGVAAIQGPSASFGLPPDAPGAERRRKLAAWITHPENPLFARVMMNRIWHYHFGQGLVKTPNDLGFNGGVPSHPELLDWLAAEFRARGWSLKAMHRLIVTSAAYQQSATMNPEAHKIDADNRLLWRHAPARMEAEVLRDSILEVSGQFNPAMGGPGFRDFNMYSHKNSWVYDPADHEGADFNRRSIYRTWARGSRDPLLTTFDCPDPSASAPVRGVTTTPLGALSLMNTSFVLRMADLWAARLEREAGPNPAAQIRRAYQLAFGRDPKSEELALTAAFLQRNGLPALCRVLLNSNEFLYVN